MGKHKLPFLSQVIVRLEEHALVERYESPQHEHQVQTITSGGNTSGAGTIVGVPWASQRLNDEWAGDERGNDRLHDIRPDESQALSCAQTKNWRTSQRSACETRLRVCSQPGLT